MQAVAIKDGRVRREDRAASREVSVRQVVRRRSRLRRLARRLLIPSILVGSFFYIGLYAGVTSTSYDNSRLAELCRQERIKNERLTVELIRRSGPSYVTRAAEKDGMVCATQYDYLHKPATVASAGAGE